MLFLGEDLILFLLLALGGALFVGNVAAIVRPPKQRESDDALERAPLARSLTYAVIGLVAAVWAIATLVTS
jgi:hypothetical protein